MSWTDQLASGISEALVREQPVRVAVHSQDQANLGKRSVGRMAPSEEAASKLTFVVIPDDEQGQYPVGAILLPEGAPYTVEELMGQQGRSACPRCQKPNMGQVPCPHCGGH